MKRIFKALLIASAVSVLAAVPAHAAWKQSKNGKDWYYTFGNSQKYFSDCWAWIDGEGNGEAECYYFGSDGKLLTSATAPDGTLVDADGCWVEADGTLHVMTYDRWIREGYTDLSVTQGYFSENEYFDALAALGDIQYYLSLEAEPASRLNNSTDAAELKKIVEEELVPCETAIYNVASIYPAYEKIKETAGITMSRGALPAADDPGFKDALNSFVSALNDDYDLINAFVNAYLENAEELDRQIREADGLTETEAAAAETTTAETAAAETTAAETAAAETTAAETAAAETTAAESAAAETTAAESAAAGNVA